MTLSKALRIVRRMNAPARGREPYWYDLPVRLLINYLARLHLNEWERPLTDEEIDLGDIPVMRLTEEHLAGWYKWIGALENEREPGRRLSPYTLDNYARNLRAFVNHVYKAGHIERSPAPGLRLPKLPAKGKRYIADEDIERMVRACRSIRDEALVLVLRDTGCRLNALAAMTVSNLAITEAEPGRLRGHAMVMEVKLKGWLHLFFGHRAADAVRRYMMTRGSGAPDALWLDALQNRPLSDAGIYQAISRVGERAGVERFNPHSFRHAKVRRMVKRGMPAKAIQDIMGWTPDKMVQEYVQHSPEDLAAYHYDYGLFDELDG